MGQLYTTRYTQSAGLQQISGWIVIWVSQFSCINWKRNCISKYKSQCYTIYTKVEKHLEMSSGLILIKVNLWIDQISDRISVFIQPDLRYPAIVRCWVPSNPGLIVWASFKLNRYIFVSPNKQNFKYLWFLFDNKYQNKIYKLCKTKKSCNLLGAKP